MSLRSKVFWLIDRIKNQSTIAKHLEHINSHLSGPDASSFLTDELHSLLRYTVKNVPYYKGVRPDLTSFPVIDKAIIRSNIENFVSQGYRSSELRKVVTSGSTGLPFQIYQDSGKVLRNTADTIYFGRLAGFELGQPLAYLKIWTSVNSKNKLEQLKENIIPIDVTKLTPSIIDNYLKVFKRRKNIAILGYPSAILELSKLLQFKLSSRPFKVSTIITMSEALELNAKLKLKEVFKCDNVFSRYSNVENGILAQQYPDGEDLFLINTASYVIEILDETDNPLPEGDTGRIVVTDLYNFGMPIIRYDTGDIGSMKTIEKVSGSFKVLNSVEGRKMDAIYDSAGQLISSFVITNQMWDYPELLQYQFIQSGKKEYIFKLNSPSKFDREGHLVNKFQGILGKEADISVTYVDEIPLLSSGKRKKVVNLTRGK